jgi:integrase
MGRAPLALGTWGLIRTHPVYGKDPTTPVRYRAIAQYGDFDGLTQPVQASGRTKTMAAQNLRQRLQTRSLAGQVGDLSGLTRFSDAADIWLARVREMVAEGRRPPRTLESYERQLLNHVNPAMGGVRLGEMTTPLVDRVLADLRKRVSPATAKVGLTVISGVMSFAVRQGAALVNPVREVERIHVQPAKPPRALIAEERIDLIRQLQEDPQARRRGITSHTFRKTAATILAEAALSARLIADQLGHARPSMTQDVYLGRRAVDDQAARALDAGLRGAALERIKRG